MNTPPARELWVEKIQNPTTRERTKRRLLRAYEIDGDVLYGSTEVYDKLRGMGYELTFNQVNHLLNHGNFSNRVRERYPELDPDNPKGLIRFKSSGQYYERYKRRRTTQPYLLVYYFENDEHQRFYGVDGRGAGLIYRDFGRMLRYIDGVDHDISHYTMHSVSLVNTQGSLRPAYDAMDRAIFDYVVDNPEYEAFNLDLICHNR